MTPEDIHKALEGVLDPEIRRPITELDMVRGVELTPTGGAIITIALTIAGCPMKGRISEDVAAAARKAGANDVQRSEEHTSELQSRGQLVCRLLLAKQHE